MVLVIVGVVVTFATLSVNPSGPGDRLDTESQRLFALAQTAADQAILSGHTVGLQVTEHGYRFIVLHQSGWKPITSGDSPLRPRRLDDDLYIDRLNAQGSHDANNEQAATLSLPVSPIAGPNPADAAEAAAANRDPTNDDRDQGVAMPAALFLSSGELLPFTLEMSAKDIDHRFHIVGTPNGEIERRRIDR